MHVIRTRNVHQALPEAIREITLNGQVRDSRNGPVKVLQQPVTTMYEEPRERVIFWADRDANPFFHLFESLWMLGGCNDLAYLEQFVKRYRSFSDDGVTLHGAYGFRWREFFGFDQLNAIAEMLRKNPEDRRCVLQMWDTVADLGRQGRDVPCNTQVYFSISCDNKLDMTVCCRSNDIIWGAYGANAVHFSILQEYVSALVGRPVGRYWQLSNNWHAYLDTLKPVEHLAERARDGVSTASGLRMECPYSLGDVEPFDLVSKPVETWNKDLKMFLSGEPAMGYRDPFFRRVAVPMLAAWTAFKTGEGVDKFGAALSHLQECRAADWRLACEDWINRRRVRWQQRGDET